MARTRLLSGTLALVVGLSALVIGTALTGSASAAPAAAPVSITGTLTSGRNQKIYEVTNKAVGAGPELTPADRTQDISGYSGDIAVDVDPSNQTVTVSSLDQRGAEYSSAVVHLTDPDLTRLEVVTDRWSNMGPVTVTGRSGDWTLTWADPFFRYGGGSSVFSYAPPPAVVGFDNLAGSQDYGRTFIVGSVDGTSDPEDATMDFTVDGTPVADCQDRPLEATPQSDDNRLRNVCTAVSGLGAGVHMVQATFSGTSTLGPGISAVTEFTVAKAAQTTTFTSTSPTGATVGGTYPAAATSTSRGEVAFSSGSPGVCTVSTAGAVVFTSEGTCTVRADQAGTSDYLPAPQVVQAVAVSRVSSTVVVDGPDGRPVGQPVRIGATVRTASGTPVGSVQFAIDGAPVGAPVPVAGTGSVQSDAVSPRAGAHQVTAVFTPTDATTYAGSSGADPLSTVKAATASSIAVGPTTLVATLTPVAPGAGAPTGSVSFTVDGATVGSAPLVATATGARATLAYAVSTAESHTVGSTYAGDADFTGSSATTGAPLDRRADLGVGFTSKVPDWARRGAIVRIDLDTVNLGPSAAPGATTTLMLPKGWKVRRLTDGALVTGRRLTVRGDLGAGATRPAYVVLKVGRKVRTKLTARVTSTVPDPTATNNTDTLKTTPSRLRRGRTS